jgi:formylglycine-generating enzyme required for sulfatase activity
VEFAVDWPEAGRYQLAIFFTRADDYGKVEVALDGRVIGERFDGFKGAVEPSGKVDFGTVALSKGSHRLRFTAVDKNPKAERYIMGIERLEFRPGLGGNLPDRGGLYRHSRNALGSHPELRYAGCFLTSVTLDYAVALGLTPAEQLRGCRDLASLGYRPASLSVAEGGAGQPLVTASLWHRPGVAQEDKEALAKRQANAAVALVRMNQTEKVWPLLKHSPDPRVRSYLIHRLRPLGAEAGAILKRFEEEKEPTIRRALLLSLGEYSEKDVLLAARPALLPKLQDIYRTNADPGLHAAAEWLLRQWKKEAWLKRVNDEWANNKEQREKRWESIRQLMKRDKEKPPPQWYVNSQGQTMVVIPGPVEFVMGSPLTEAGRREDNERQHKKWFRRSFALAAAPVTKEQFLLFQPGGWQRESKFYPAPSCPIGGVTWFEAAAYCNWLSRQEGIDEKQWCYESKNGQVSKLKANYLSLTGYRLPTEAEMEYATRAGAVTGRYYGETEELLPKYAWYIKNSEDKTWPVGSLKPNDFGLFDMQGNVYTWCQEKLSSYAQYQVFGTEEDKEDINNIKIGETDRDPDHRIARGGSYHDLASFVRSASRSTGLPAVRWIITFGFRPARTCR